MFSLRRLSYGLSVALCLGAPMTQAGFDPLNTHVNDQEPSISGWGNAQGQTECESPVQEQNQARPLTLSDVVDLSLCHNAQIKSAWVGIKIQANILGEARSAYLPTASATFTRMGTKTVYPDSLTQIDPYWGNSTYLSLSWRLADFGERAATVSSARYSRDSAQANYQAMVQRTLADVVNVYFTALRLKSEMDVQNDMVARAQKVVQFTLKKEVSGIGDPGDTLQASVSLTQTRISAQRAKTEYEKQLALLKHQIGVTNDIQIVLPDPTENLEQLDKISDEMYKVFLKQLDTHPAVVASEKKQAAQQQQVVIARSQALPSVDLFVNRYGDGYPGQSVSTTHSNTTTWGFTVNVPLFAGFRHFYKS